MASNPKENELWLEKKANFDSAKAGGDGSQWLCHKKWYDLKEWVPKHPGGAWWLSKTQGMDVTVYVETHHLDGEKIKKIMKKYYVKDASPDYEPVYDWEGTGFYPTLKKRVCEYFKKNQISTNASPMMKTVFWCMVGLYWTFFLSSIYTGNFWFSFLAGLIMPALHGIHHNLIHQRDSWLVHWSATGGWKTPEARISHILSHHHFPNMQELGGHFPFKLDIEYIGLEPLFYNSERDAPKYNTTFMVARAYLIVFTAYAKDTLQTIYRIFIGMLTFQPEHLLNLTQLILPVLFWGPLHGVLMFSTMHLTFGFVDGICGYPLHRSNFVWTEGSVKERWRDFGKHCLSATLDHSLDQPWWIQFFFWEMLNFHTVHHFFPTMCASKFHHVRPIMEQTMKEHGVHNVVSDIFSMNWSMFQAWRGIWNWRFVAPAELKKKM